MGGGLSKGKALFQRKREEEERKEEMDKEEEKVELLPGVDFEEIEDEFERLHRQMMGED